MAEKTTATVKKGIAYYNRDDFSLSNIDKVKTIDFSQKYVYLADLSFSRSGNDLEINLENNDIITINDYFNSQGSVASTVKTIRVYDGDAKKRYKDYNLVSSGLLDAINSGVENFAIKKGTITGTAFADTISATGDRGVTIKTGSGNDNITGTSSNDTFYITGSGKKTINIKATDGNDIIKGINTKNASLVLNLSNTVLDNVGSALNNLEYERNGNDLKITAYETIPTKITDLSNYIWYKEGNGDIGIAASDNPPANSYFRYYSFSEKPLYSYQDGEETKYTKDKQKSKSLNTTTLFTFQGEYGLKHQYLVTEDGYDYWKKKYQDYYGDWYDESCLGEVKLSDLTDVNGVKHLYTFVDNYMTDREGRGSKIQYATTVTKWSDLYMKSDGFLTNNHTEGATKLSEMKASGIKGIYWIKPDVYHNAPCYTYTDEDNVPSNATINIKVEDFDTTYYCNEKYFYCENIKDYDVDNTYYTWTEYSPSDAPYRVNEYDSYLPITTTPVADDYYTAVDTIYSYIKDGSMAYALDAKTANYDEDATAPNSSITIIKDYFKNLVAPDVQIGTKNIDLLDALNKTDMVKIDKSTPVKKQTINGTFLNDVITGCQGNDTINLASGYDRVNAGKGNDTINIKGEGKKVITINNVDGNDTITGTATTGAKTYLNFTDINIDDLEYVRSKNNLIIKRTYTIDGKENTSTTTIKDYFKNTTYGPDIFFGDGESDTKLKSKLEGSEGFVAGTKGTHLNDIITGTQKADKITTGGGKDIVTGGKGNDQITIDGYGNKYIVMNPGDGTDTISTKGYGTIYLQFNGAGITDNNNTVQTKLKYEKSGKNDIKITTTDVGTSVIIKDYLTKGQDVYIKKTSSYDPVYERNLGPILETIGLDIGNAGSKKAQTLTGSRVNDNIFGGSGNDKITTGESFGFRGDVITPGRGNDTIIINGDGKKTINIANKDGNDTIIFTDNNKKTAYDYTTYKRLFLKFDDDATLSYDKKGKDLVIKRTYDEGTKTKTATTTLKDYFNVKSKSDLAKTINIYNPQTKEYIQFDPSVLEPTVIDKSKIKKAQTINGDLLDNIITGGSGKDTINGCGGSDTMDGGNGSDTYVVNYKSGSKHSLYDKIVISDSGTGAKDVDTLKLDVEKKDMALLFNVNKIMEEKEYTSNDIIVGDNHYSYDSQLMIFGNWEYIDYVRPVDTDHEKLTTDCGIVADGLEKITTSDKKTVTLENIAQIAQDVASWLSVNNYDSSADVRAKASESWDFKDVFAMVAKYNPDNTAIQEYVN